ncbi:MAG: hypothetical protein H6767_00465 [Candidatus Peribacteria bacterium]|nr:MAG: hypothetical protein H6767_00465 [Candidatus Peribacteria bacterium]
MNGLSVAGGKLGNAGLFDGVNDFVQVPNIQSSLNGLTTLSLSTWVKSSLVHTDRGIIYGKDPDGLDWPISLRYDADGAGG